MAPFTSPSPPRGCPKSVAPTTVRAARDQVAPTAPWAARIRDATLRMVARRTVSRRVARGRGDRPCVARVWGHARHPRLPAASSSLPHARARLSYLSAGSRPDVSRKFVVRRRQKALLAARRARGLRPHRLRQSGEPVLEILGLVGDPALDHAGVDLGVELRAPRAPAGAEHLQPVAALGDELAERRELAGVEMPLEGDEGRAHAVEDRVVERLLDRGPADLGDLALVDLAAGGQRQQLRPETDPPDRGAVLEQRAQVRPSRPRGTGTRRPGGRAWTRP